MIGVSSCHFDKLLFWRDHRFSLNHNLVLGKSELGMVGWF